jgi:hypothetical protein
MSFIKYNVSDPHSFETYPDPDAAQNLNAEPDPDPGCLLNADPDPGFPMVIKFSDNK